MDLKALPEPDANNTLGSSSYAAPRNAMETLLVSVWEDVLQRPAIGIHDNFFHIGGDSIKALQITGRLGAQGLSLSIKSLFLQPTIAQLAASVTSKEQHYPQELLSGEVPLTATQAWFFDQVRVDRQQFNQSFFLSSKQTLDAGLLQQSLQAVMAQHDLLRATYQQRDGAWVQTIQEMMLLELSVVHVDTADDADSVLAAHANAAQAGFDLAAGPLVKAILFRKQAGEELLLVLHHLVVDGVSWRILLEDLTMVYSQLAAGKLVSLPPKTAPFAWWSEKIREYVNSPTGSKQCQYWNAVLQAPVDALPVAYPDQPNRVHDSAVVEFRLDKHQTVRLLEQTNRAYNTEINDVLLCALSRALQQVFGGKHYQITLEGHGREPLFEMDVSRTVGWFTSVFPVVLDYATEPGYHLQAVKENLRRIPHKGMDYLLLHYLGWQPFVQTARDEISFNYLGTFDQQQGGLLAFSDRYVGAAISPFIERDCELDVLGMVIDGQLQLSITYGQQRMDTARMNALAQAFGQELTALVEHCITRETPVMTPADFTACPLSLAQYRKFLHDNGLSADEIEDIYTLSPLQEGMLFHKLLEPDSPAYFNQVELAIDTALDVPHFVRCWEKIVQAYPVLRTSFFAQGLATPLQVVRKSVALDFSQHNLSGQSATEQEQVIQAYIRADRQRDFRLDEPSLMRLALFQTGAAQYRLVVSDSHIITDGWSQATLLQELKRLYRRETDTLTAKPYSSYIRWLNEQSVEDGTAFWQDYLACYEETAAVPRLSASQSAEVMDSQRECLELSEAQTRALNELAKSCSVSLNTVVQGLWAVVLSTYTHKQDVVFGMTTSGRSASVPDIEALCGLFINTIPLRIRWSVEDSFTDLLANIQQSAVSIQEHEHDSLAMIQSTWNGEGELVDHMIAFENYPAEAESAAQQDVLNIRHVNGYDPVHYDFALVVDPGKQLQVHLVYNRHRLGTDWIRHIKSHLRTAIDAILHEPQQPLLQINLMSPAEQHLLLHEFNNTRADFPADKTLIDLFAAQVAKTPDHIAVYAAEGNLTYRELDEKSNALAWALRCEYAIQADDIIALQLQRSPWMVVAILGVMKAGAGYLPIAVDFPENRVRYILQDSQAKALLVDDAVYPQASIYAGQLPVVSVAAMPEQETGAIASIVNSRNLAYVIYTSGSTGNPKGVMIEHQGIVNRLHWMQRAYPIGEQDCILQKTPYTFDVSVWELLWWSLQGASVALLEHGAEKEPAKIIEAIEQYQVTTMHFVPSMLNLFLAYTGQNPIQQQTRSLRQVFASGEALGIEQIQQFNARIGNQQTRLHNLYGPTEASVDVSYFDCAELGNRSLVPIGKPIDNIALHIVDENHQLVPLGVTGELCISGVGLARGYINNALLTAEKFIPSPLKQGERLYKTGDLARWLPDGNIDFLGRIDFQLKIRGYRIEAGDIEQKLLAHPEIDNAIVLGKQANGVMELVAYLACEQGKAPALEDLRNYLSQDLPSYMVPTYFVNLDSLPLNASGKVDRKALPELQENLLITGGAYVAPRTETEQLLAVIWQQVLERETVGVNDNFFHLGGHSLKAIRLLGQLQDKLALQLPLQLLFQYPVLAEQAAQLDALQQGGQAGQHPQGMRFNPDAQPTLFTFPPFFGLSVWYRRLAEQLVDISFYCFDFLLDENRLEVYYQQIKREQPQGPYLLFGYSAGGSLAYAMADYLEAQGETVVGIIMGDSMVVSDMQTDMEGYLDDLAAALSTREDAAVSGLLELVRNQQLRPQTLQRLRGYEDFLNSCRDQGIQADIHLIKAEFEASIPNMHQRWDTFTQGNFHAYQATGSHDYLFEAEHLDGNAALLQHIIETSLSKAKV